jgi:8-oxo-dGTP diphosphatase
MLKQEKFPKVGIGVIVRRNSKVLMGKRKGSHGEFTWNFPGGHLDFGESIFSCAKREVLEEAGIKVKNLMFGPYTNDIFKKEGRHYITLFVIADFASGKTKVLEPLKCEKWDWFSWEELPSPLFLPIKNLLKKNFSPFKRKKV